MLIVLCTLFFYRFLLTLQVCFNPYNVKSSTVHALYKSFSYLLNCLHTVGKNLLLRALKLSKGIGLVTKTHFMMPCVKRRLDFTVVFLGLAANIVQLM